MLLQDGSRIPHGLGIFLKAAQAEEDEADRVVLSLPPGPGLERLSGESRAAHALQDAFSEALGRPVRLAIRSAGAGRPTGPQRLTPEQVRSDRLARIAGEQPLLARAVRDWDLELLDS